MQLLVLLAHGGSPVQTGAPLLPARLLWSGRQSMRTTHQSMQCVRLAAPRACCPTC